MYIFLSILALRKAVLTSTWWTSHPLVAATANKARDVAVFGTGARVSSKSRPETWLKPWATSRALYRVFFLSASFLMSNKKRVLTALLCLLLPSLVDHVPRFLCVATSSLMSCFHSGHSGRARASFSLSGGLVKSQLSLDADPARLSR